MTKVDTLVALTVLSTVMAGLGVVFGGVAFSRPPIVIYNYTVNETTIREIVSTNTSTWSIPNGNAIYVSPIVGNDSSTTGTHEFPFETLSRAIEYIQSVGSSNSSRFYIQLEPGIHYVNNTAGGIVVPDYVYISTDHPDSAVMISMSDSNPMFILDTVSSFTNLVIYGPASNYVFYVNNSDQWYVHNIRFMQGDILMYIIGSSNSEGSVEHIRTTESVNGILVAEGGAFVHLSHLQFHGIGTMVTARNTNTVVWMSNVDVVDNTYTCVSICISDGAKMHADTINIYKASIGITALNGTFTGSSVYIDEHVPHAIVQEDAAAVIIIISGSLYENSIMIADGGAPNVELVFRNLEEDILAMAMTTDLNIGIPEEGRFVRMGQGGMYVRGMRAYTENATTIEEITSLVDELDGVYGSFAGNAINSAIYFGSDLNTTSGEGVKTWGVQLHIVSAGTGGTYVWETYQTGAWVPFSVMVTEEGNSHTSYSQDAFSRVKVVNVRFAHREIYQSNTTDPVARGHPHYWVRCRITVSPSVLPKFDLVKLIPSTTIVSSDGFTEYYGQARPVGMIYVSHIGWQSTGATGNPGSQDLYIGSGTSDSWYGFGGSRNSYDTDGQTAGFIFALPRDLDTSSKIKIRLYFHSTVTSTYSFKMYTTHRKDGDAVTITPTGGTPANIVSDTQSFIGTANVQSSVSFTLDVADVVVDPSYENPHVFWMWIQRVSSSAVATANMISMSIRYIKWGEGGHIGNW